MKTTLIIPCCGSLKYGSIPAYLAYRPSGELLLEESLKGLKLEHFERVLVVIPYSHISEWNAERKIRYALPIRNLDIVALKFSTSGPAETVMAAIDIAKVKGSILVKDADNCISFKMPEDNNYIVGIDIYNYHGEIRELKNKSFLVANEQCQLMDVVEKRICSSLVCLGAYGFENTEDFREAFKALQDPVYRLDKLYVSEIITYLMGVKGTIFTFVTASDYQNWGNEYDLRQKMKPI